MSGSPVSTGLFSQKIIIGVGDMATSNNPEVTLSTYALGSCIGIITYDTKQSIGALLHFMLPDSSIAPDKARSKPSMFADTGITEMIRSLNNLGSNTEDLVCFCAGGSDAKSNNSTFKIGQRNQEAAQTLLEKYGFNQIRTDLGGIENRTLHFLLETGKLTVKTPSEERILSLT